MSTRSTPLRNRTAPLSQEDVRAIQASEQSAAVLAIVYDVCVDTIRRIRRGEQRYARAQLLNPKGPY